MAKNSNVVFEPKTVLEYEQFAVLKADLELGRESLPVNDDPHARERAAAMASERYLPPEAVLSLM